MQNKRFKYTILKNTDGKYWLWFDEKGKLVEGTYVPNLQPYHEIDTRSVLREGAEVWTEDLVSVPEACQLRPLGEYTDAYRVKARLRDESKFLANPTPGANAPKDGLGGFSPVGKKPGRG